MKPDFFIEPGDIISQERPGYKGIVYYLVLPGISTKTPMTSNGFSYWVHIPVLPLDTLKPDFFPIDTVAEAYHVFHEGGLLLHAFKMSLIKLPK